MTNIEWQTSIAPEDYMAAVADMEARAARIAAGQAAERIWLLEHPALYTAGTSAQSGDLIDKTRLPVFQAGRGGQYTYHGPGQRIVYVQLNLAERGRNVRSFVTALEQWLIDCLADFGVQAERRCGRVGVWVVMPDGTEAKIAAIGIRIRRWVSFHGLSVNIAPDLAAYDGIIACGLKDHGVTSLAVLGKTVSFAKFDASLLAHWPRCLASLSLPGL